MAIETNELIDVKTLPPFKKFIMTIGALPTSYLESMTYAELLMWFCNYLQETVIPAVNNNAQAVEELQNLFEELKQYVDDYFSDLNLQTEVDNKLDAMVEDGTLAEIINQEIFTELNNTVNEVKTDIGTMSNLATVKKDTLVNAINSANGNVIDTLRYKYSNNYEYFELPVINSFFDNVKIYKDKYKGNYDYVFNPLTHKNSGGSEIYVNPDTNESSGTQTGAVDHPFNNILKAWNIASDNDTIVLMNGVYTRDKINLSSSDYIDKSINIISQNGKYKTFLTDGDNLSWTQNSTYSNVYQATRSGLSAVIDMRGKDKGLFSKLTLASSLANCSITLNSYYYESNVVYVNIGEVPDKTKVIASLNLGASRIKVKPSDHNINVYLQDLCCINGGYDIFSFESYSSYKPTIIGNNCDFLFGNYDGQNAVSMVGADSILYKCKANYACRDGFNYHANSGTTCNSIEIECIGANNGLNDSNNNNNGSTTHDGNSVLRINGIYFNNKGGNVTDVQSTTKSINIQCIAYDSKSTGTTSKGDFINQQAGCDMWLYNCYSKGSSSYVNIYGVADTNIYVDNCKYDNAYSDGTININ